MPPNRAAPADGSRTDSAPISLGAECSQAQGAESTELEHQVLLGAGETAAKGEGSTAVLSFELEADTGPPKYRRRLVIRCTLILTAVFGLLCVVYAVTGLSTSSPDSDSAAPGVIPTGPFAVGTHNSYHEAPAGAVLSALVNFGQAAVAEELNVTLPSLTEQLRLGLESFELDVYADPQGGLYLTPWVVTAGLEQPRSASDQAKMGLPGWKVFHVQDLDTRSSCLTLRDCLQAFHAYPRTRTLYVLIEIKYDVLDLDLPLELTTPLSPADHPELWDSLEDEVRSLANADPPVRFLIDNPELSKQYVQLRPVASTRVLLPNLRRFDSIPTGWTMDEFFVQCNNPLEGHQDWNRALGSNITSVVEQGFLVRTRSDTDGHFNEVRARAAFNSGAKIIQSDAIAETLEFRDKYYAGNYTVN